MINENAIAKLNEMGIINLGDGGWVNADAKGDDGGDSAHSTHDQFVDLGDPQCPLSHFDIDP